MVVRGEDKLATALEAENQFSRTSDLRVHHELTSASGIPERSARRLHMILDAGVHPRIEVAGIQVTDIEIGELLVHRFGNPIRECALIVVYNEPGAASRAISRKPVEAEGRASGVL